MALLSTEDRQRIWEETPYNKAALLAAVAATDAWIEANQVSFNAALPNPFRSQASAAQKALLFCAVALMRVDPGLAQLLRRALGVEVD